MYADLILNPKKNDSQYDSFDAHHKRQPLLAAMRRWTGNHAARVGAGRLGTFHKRRLMQEREPKPPTPKAIAV